MRKPKAITTPQNARQWSGLVSDCIVDMLNSARDRLDVTQVTNAFGKQIALARTQIEYATARKEKPRISWLNSKP